MRQVMPKNPRLYQKLWGRIYATLDRFPAGMPVTVVITSKLPKRCGESYAYFERYKDRFVLYLLEPPFADMSPYKGKMTLREQFMWDGFIHEYAHVIDYTLVHDSHDPPYAEWHGATWGVKYAKIYQSILQDP